MNFAPFHGTVLPTWFQNPVEKYFSNLTDLDRTRLAGPNPVRAITIARLVFNNQLIEDLTRDLPELKTRVPGLSLAGQGRAEEVGNQGGVNSGALITPLHDMAQMVNWIEQRRCEAALVRPQNVSDGKEFASP